MKIRFYYCVDDKMAREIATKLNGTLVSVDNKSGFLGSEAPDGYDLIETNGVSIDEYLKELRTYKNTWSGDFVTLDK